MTMTEMPISKIRQMHPDQWVMVEVTRRSASHKATHGRVMGSAACQDDLTEIYEAFRQQNPTAQVYEFYTGPLVEEGVAVVL